MDYIDDAATLNKKLETLDLEVTTVDANDGESDSLHYVNIIFTDGTRLYEPENLGLYHTIEEPFGFRLKIGTLPKRGKKATFRVYDWQTFPGGGVNRTLGDIAEVYLRKDGNDGWFMGSVILYANGKPLLGNSKANQFLDNDDKVLQLRDWSTSSFCVAQTSGGNQPLIPSGYRVLGPVIGQVSDTSANVLYRVDREGNYRFRATDAISGITVYDQILKLNPTRRFELYRLQPNRRYNFTLRFVRGGVESSVPGADGSLSTYPPEGSRGRFTFAFGSCANPGWQVAQGSWTAICALAANPPADIDPIRLFVHLGDTFYFYDKVTEEVPPVNVESMQAAHVSMRRHIEFLDMAKVVPSCGIWDDHDFAGDNTDSTIFADSNLPREAVDTWLEYWGNQPISRSKMGLTTRISHGLTDIYLIDGRFRRNREEGVCFGSDIITGILDSIDNRGSTTPRTVVLGTGSTWNHHRDDEEGYGHSEYDNERENLYEELACRMGKSINGLLFISGDYHINEIYHVNLGHNRMAPEFVSSPLTRNSDLRESRAIKDERFASFPSDEKRGFATLTIDTSRRTRGNWTATVRYFQEAAAMKYASRSYTLSNGQFNPDPV